MKTIIIFVMALMMIGLVNATTETDLNANAVLKFHFTNSTHDNATGIQSSVASRDGFNDSVCLNNTEGCWFGISNT